MASPNDFEGAFNFIMKWEGAYSNDPNDRGGETKFGISQHAHPDVDVASLTREAAKDIYRVSYWNRLNCPALPMPLAVAVFDGAVNCGTGTAAGWLAKSSGDWATFNTLRLAHYAALVNKDKSQRQYLRGWVNRLVDLNWFCMRYEENGAGHE